ncbi:hypothetical protein [Clostridium sp.]|uniref:hypothetical protein n=1 Tax=Clostridium sp. TaxID=1506 RepID=UPI001DD93770|nr:hypothetical protein [Clostridium sp.]MBS5307811.1 hypothetical protein [Clostridium sp.]
MDLILQRFKSQLQEKLISYEIDNYNENTYNYSQGYRKCLLDLLEELDSKIG